MAGLFIQLLVIRWLQVRMPLLGYLQNLVLITCFLGLAIGSLTSHAPVRLYRVLLALLGTVLPFAIPGLKQVLLHSNVLLTWSNPPGLVHTVVSNLTSADFLGHFVLYVGLLFFLLACTMWSFIPLGRITARLLAEDPEPLRGYLVNLLGSLLGIWLFVLLSGLRQPPAVWLAVACASCLWLASRYAQLGPRPLLLAALLIGAGWAADYNPQILHRIYSPYSQLEVSLPRPGEGMMATGDLVIGYNGSSYQCMLDLRPESVARQPERFPSPMAGLSQYDIPGLLQPGAKEALILGGGSGNDAAGLLRNGVEHVTVIDIDPDIIRLGRKLHPEKPYWSDKVTIVNDDARAYAARCQDKYDLIVMGLLDGGANTLVSATRPDHYVYTLENLKMVRSLLKPGGILTLTFEPGFAPHVPERLFLTLKELFGRDPLWFRIPFTSYGWGGVMFVASDDLAGVARRLEANPRLAEQVLAWRNWYPTFPRDTTARLATDDWPFLYLAKAEVPSAQLLCFGLAFLLVLGLGPRRTAGILRSWTWSRTHFFCLGAAFMLLETHNIGKACVVFGSTWWVNAIVISGILLMIIVSTLLAAAFPRLPQPPLYAVLIAVCLGLSTLEPSQLVALSLGPRLLLTGGLTALPMAFSGLIFAASFARSRERDLDLGANLMGALAGGLLQMLVYVTGMRALMLLVAFLYLLAGLTSARGPR